MWKTIHAKRGFISQTFWVKPGDGLKEKIKTAPIFVIKTCSHFVI